MRFYILDYITSLLTFISNVVFGAFIGIYVYLKHLFRVNF